MSTDIKVTVEFFGNSRLITGCESVDLAFTNPPGLNASDIVRQLGMLFPSLDGKVLELDQNRLLGSYVFNLNGKGFSDHRKLDLQNGDSLLILPSQAGG